LMVLVVSAGGDQDEKPARRAGIDEWWARRCERLFWS